MKLQLIRNATLRLNYAGHTILIDPYLAPKHSLPSYAGRSPNPLVELPMGIDDVLQGIELVVISHLHTDHFDKLAQASLPPEIPIFCQPGNEERIRDHGFLAVTPIASSVSWQGISIQHTPGQHGSSEAVLQAMGEVSGFVLRAKGEPTVYWAGDTIWYGEIRKNIDRWQPEIIITHSGGAVWGDNEQIIMDAEQTAALCRYAPEAVVIATHMEALDHCLESRASLRGCADRHGIDAERLRIPLDGAEITL